ncbi:MAG TPA: beta-N-acetylhexosaminidase [Vicinamibacterales bacterium]|nr:beta-N-acetylhexosaminidase [Vicinamibacterales bacterium]
MSPQPLRRRIGQLLIGSFSGSVIPVELRSMAREFDLGGITLFGRLGNIESPGQVGELAFDVRNLGRELPGWVGIDQEGGRVARLRSPFTEWPPMAVLGRSGDSELARKFAEALAAELSAVGISLDYAPVLDIHTNPQNPVIGDRALGEKPETVATLGRVIIEELQRAGVAACGKHFPGHGDTATDSHVELPIVEHPPDRLRAVEFLPFKAAIDARVAFIMTAHVLVTSIDDERPATLSPRIVKNILRDELGFTGVIVSDDLEMRAIANSYSPGEAAVAAIEAGCDAVLMCGVGPHADIELQAQALEALVHAVEDDRLPVKQVEAALERNRQAKERFAREWRPPTPAQLKAVVGSDKHRAISEQMASFA